MTTSLLGAPVARAIDERTRSALAAGAPGQPPATLVSVHRAVESPFRFYLQRQAKAAGALGIAFRDEPLGAQDGMPELLERIARLDRDRSVHGVLLEHPLPAPFDFSRAIEQLRPEKDIDGVSPGNLGRLLGQRPLHVPAVARAALEIARFYRLPLEGEPVGVLGRSETVGLPLAVLLASRPPGANASVTLVHSRSRDLAAALRPCRTIFSCVGRPGLLDRTTVPEGAHVVDVGLSSVADPARPGGMRAVGDADAAALDGWAASLTPVPGGVGPVTVAALMENVARARQLQRPEAAR
jgi:methylenetetrahydrofolate dehydrogenase (NADP+)/methenyltetrahydrofolate cyclohydrolase